MVKILPFTPLSMPIVQQHTSRMGECAGRRSRGITRPRGARKPSGVLVKDEGVRTGISHLPTVGTII